MEGVMIENRKIRSLDEEFTENEYGSNVTLVTGKEADDTSERLESRIKKRKAFVKDKAENQQEVLLSKTANLNYMIVKNIFNLASTISWKKAFIYRNMITIRIWNWTVFLN